MNGMIVMNSLSSTVVTDKIAWDEHYNGLPSHLRDINFSYDYYHLYQLNGHGNAELFVIKEEGEVFFYPYLLRTIDSDALPSGYFDIESAYGYSGPICTTDNPEFISRCTESFNAHCIRKKIVCEFIRFHPLMKNQNLLQRDTTLKQIPLRDYVYVDLGIPFQELWNSFTSQNRNKIRKAEKNNVEVIRDNELTHFNDFERIYLANMEQLSAARLYFFSREFFDGLKNLARNNGFLLVAKKENEVLGASIFLTGKLYGHYFLSSATPDGKKYAVSNLLLCKGIKYCQEAGMKKLHLGGGISEAQDDPLLVFKKNFSSLTAKFYIGKRIHLEREYKQLCTEWDRRFAPLSEKYQSILQRYRLSEADLV
jgi:hypothetical protein